MLVDEIKFGESVNIEFKREVPQKSEKYIKSVIAEDTNAGIPIERICSNSEGTSRNSLISTDSFFVLQRRIQI